MMGSTLRKDFSGAQMRSPTIVCCFHDLPLGGVQWAGLQQHELGHGDLADIMHDSAAPQVVAILP